MIASGESGMAVKNPEETKGWWYEVTWACSRYIVVTGIAVVDPKNSRTEVLVSPLRYAWKARSSNDMPTFADR